MVRQFAVDEEIERSEAEAAVVGGAVRLAVTRVDVYLASDAGKAELAQETSRTRAAAARSKILMRGASPEKRRRASARDVFDSFDVDGSGTIDKTELEPLLRALGMAVSEAELKVALASVDADGSGDVSFSEFYAWFAGNGAGDDVGDDVGSLDDDMMSVANTRSERSEFSAASSGRPSAVGASRGLRNAARATFVKVRRSVRTATGSALKERARRAVVRRWVASVARQTQVRFREDRAPVLECCVCHQAFRLYGEYWRHFGGGGLAGAGYTCGREREVEEGQPRGQHRYQRGRLFLDPTSAVGEEWHRWQAAERQWTRLLDERRCLEVAGIKAEAAEEARLGPKGSTGARELSGLAARLLTALLVGLKSDGQVGSSTPSTEARRAGVPSPDEARSAVARLAFQSFDRDGNGALDVSDLADLLGVLKGVAGEPSSAGSGTGTLTGAATTGLGLEAAMDAMDEDRSGQINIDEFMNWFNGHDIAAEWTSPFSSGRSPQGPGARLHVKVRSNLAGGDGGRGHSIQRAAGGIEEGEEDGGNENSKETGNDGSSSSSSGSSGSYGSDGSEGSSSESSEGSRSSTATEHGGGATGAGAKRAATKQKSLAVSEKRGGKSGGLFGVGVAWRRTKTAGAEAGSLATTTSGKNPAKRKRRGGKKGQAQQGGGEETGEAKRRRHRRSADKPTGDGSLAPSPPSTNGAHTASPLRGRGASVSPGRLMLRSLRRAGSPAVADPWKRHGKTLRAVAEHEARTLLLRRARLRAQVDELARFRATRSPEFRSWSSLDFLEEHREAVAEISEESDVAFVESLRCSLREAEKAVRHGTTTRGLTPSTMAITPSAAGATLPAPTAAGVHEHAAAETAASGASDTPGVVGDTTVEGGTTTTVPGAISEAFTPLGVGGRGDLGGVFADDTVGNGGEGSGSATTPPGRLASSISFVRSLGRKSGMASNGGRNARRHPGADLREIVKAAEADAAASRLRELRTATGRADIARTVVRLKANKAIAAAVTTAAAAAAAAAAAEEEEAFKAETTGTDLLDGEERAPGPVEAPTTPAASAAATAAAARAEKETKALVDKGVQLFGLFDADGAGTIDLEELAPLLEQLGIWVLAEMAREVFPRLDLGCSGDIRQEELVEWLENEGVAFRQTPLSRVLRARQSVQALGSSSRRLENQVRASMISRSRATARAETWDSLSGVPETPPSLSESPPPTEAGLTRGHGENKDGQTQQVPEADADEQQETRQQGRVESAGILGEAVAPAGAITGGRKRGRALAARAAERRRRTGEQERGLEREMVVKRAEDEAERRVKRHWRTQAGAAELRREADRVHGAGEATSLTLRAWDAGAHTSVATASPVNLRRRREEEKLRHLFRLFDTSCDGCIDAEELGRLLSRMNLRVSEPEVVALLQQMDGDGSGDVDLVEFSEWWHTTGQRLCTRPAARVRSAASSLAATVAPMAAARRDARRALITSARSQARAEVKAALRVEDDSELPPLLGVTTAGASTNAAAASNVKGNENPMALAGTSCATRDASASAGMQDPIMPASIFGDTLLGAGGGGHGQGGSSPSAKQGAAARASKLAMAEAEAYADVQATLRTDAGKRELARRARALRLEWEAAVKAADRIARGKRPRRGRGKQPRETAGERPAVDALTTLVELPFLRFLWGVHGSTTGGAAGAAAGGDSYGLVAGIEPTELKYLGASLRQTLAGRATRRVMGSEATILGSTLALGKTVRVANPSETGRGVGPRRAAPEVQSPSSAAPDAMTVAASAGGGEVLTTSGIFDGDSDDEIRSLKTLTRVGIGDLVSSLGQTGDNKSRTKAQIRADLAAVAKIRRRVLFTPSVFRALAKEALLAEGRAFERHELARTLALEDGEPWRLAEAAASKRGVESAGGVAPADVDRLRATAAGAAKLSRALAQGEDLAAAECRSFLKTSAGRAELRAATAATRDQRRHHRQLEPATAVDSSRGGSIPGVPTIKRAFSAIDSLARDELRRAFLLCEVDRMSGEISRSEAAHVLAYAGIPQTTVATAGRVRVPRQGKGKAKQNPRERPPRRKRRGGRRNQHRPPRGQRPSRRSKTATNRSERRPAGEGERARARLWQTLAAFRRMGGSAGGGGRRHKKDTGSSGSSGRARICPTNNDQADGDGDGDGGVVVAEVVERSTTGTSDGCKLGGLGGGGGGGGRGGAERPGTGGDDQRQEEKEEEEDGDEVSSGSGSSSEGEGDDGVDSGQSSAGEFCVDMDVVDDVTNDEGFELGEMEILLAAARVKQTRLAKAASLGRLLAGRALPAYLTDARDARIVLMSHARSAGRDKAMHKFENFLKIGAHDKEGLERVAASPTPACATNG